MKRLRLSLSLALAGTLAFSLVLGLGLASGRGGVGLAVVCGCGALACATAAWQLVMRLLIQVRTFVKALEMKDFTLHFPTARDRMARDVAEGMNRIIALHRDGTNALETRKLYYDRILRVMTHELRNGITPIVALAADMNAHPGRYRDANLAEAVALIADESTAIKRFLDSYYELTHLPPPEIRAVDSSEFFMQIDRTVRLMLKDRGLADDTLVYAVARDMAMEMDAGLMKRAIVNIVKNAIEAVAGNSEPRIEITASRPQGRSYITITDNGCGMTPEVLDNLFQPFFTTKPSGSGIGLCLCRQIVRLHGGDIRVSSGPGLGTTFHITLGA